MDGMLQVHPHAPLPPPARSIQRRPNATHHQRRRRRSWPADGGQADVGWSVSRRVRPGCGARPAPGPAACRGERGRARCSGAAGCLGGGRGGGGTLGRWRAGGTGGGGGEEEGESAALNAPHNGRAGGMGRRPEAAHSGGRRGRLCSPAERPSAGSWRQGMGLDDTYRTSGTGAPGRVRRRIGQRRQRQRWQSCQRRAWPWRRKLQALGKDAWSFCKLALAADGDASLTSRALQRGSAWAERIHTRCKLVAASTQPVTTFRGWAGLDSVAVDPDATFDSDISADQVASVTSSSNSASLRSPSLRAVRSGWGASLVVTRLILSSITAVAGRAFDFQGTTPRSPAARSCERRTFEPTRWDRSGRIPGYIRLRQRWLSRLRLSCRERHAAALVSVACDQRCPRCPAWRRGFAAAWGWSWFSSLWHRLRQVSSADAASAVSFNAVGPACRCWPVTVSVATTAASHRASSKITAAMAMAAINGSNCIARFGDILWVSILVWICRIWWWNRQLN